MAERNLALILRSTVYPIACGNSSHTVCDSPESVDLYK